MLLKDIIYLYFFPIALKVIKLKNWMNWNLSFTYAHVCLFPFYIKLRFCHLHYWSFQRVKLFYCETSERITYLSFSIIIINLMEYKPYNVKSNEMVSKLRLKYIKFYTINPLLLDNSYLLIIFAVEIYADRLIADILLA